MIDKIIKPASLRMQAVVISAVICSIVGAFSISDVLFPPSMTPQCVYLIEKYPLEEFSFIDASARDETMKCLHIKWKYKQKTWKLNENFISR